MDIQKLNRLLELCIQEITENLKIDVIVSLGPIENGYRSVHRSYQHACRIKDYRLLPSNTLLNFENLHENNAKYNPDFELDFGHLKSLIVSKDKDEAIRYIDHTFNRLETGEGVTPEYVQGLTMEILFHIFGTLHVPNHHLDVFRKHSDHALFDILRMHRIADMTVWLKSLITDYMDSLEHAYDNIHPLVKTVLQYIDKNYAQEMSLKTLSATFNINAAYLGQLFKKTTGEIFSNYLNNVRIQKSKELLAATQLKSNQIATAVGFVNVNYFSNVFKKLTGVYPIEYRKSIQA
ncbi:helix-turn-helix domain-containing protein [Cohnella herbarum]|uniref:Helix-turn-helix domain-containing protein n=1 Tax=Cohnella herbarum TaxID=2728023 RepID=A0A7Z2ZNN7_9BACL|nr:helix-turn-helix domain-containing protein [Cohnella herbarum]QJD86269.1 helix-turn-helix domain-containing protein [Cohnella herbarum]